MNEDHNQERRKIFCPNCQQKLDVTDFPVFSEIECPVCRNSLLIPVRFGHYLLEKPILNQEISTLYQAVDLKLDRLVALKILSKSICRKPEVIDPLVRQTKVLAALNHSNIITIFSTGEEEEQYYIAMEHMPGHSLYSKVNQEYPLDKNKALDYIKQAAQGLAVAHRQGINHGDINPHNILFGAEDNVKISDFNMSDIKTVAAANGEIDLEYRDFRYAAPEVIQTGEADHRSDIFTLGASLYYALIGDAPFSDLRYEYELEKANDDPEDQINDISPCFREPIKERPNIGKAINNFILHLMAPAPEDRPSNYQELINEIEQLQRFGFFSATSSPEIHNENNKLKTSSILMIPGKKLKEKYQYIKKQKRRFRILFLLFITVLSVFIYLLFTGHYRDIKLNINTLLAYLPFEFEIDQQQSEAYTNENTTGKTEVTPETSSNEQRIPGDSHPEGSVSPEPENQGGNSTSSPEINDSTEPENQGGSSTTENNLNQEDDNSTDSEPLKREIPNFKQRPMPPGVKFTLKKEELLEYVHSHSTERLREIERERIVRLSRLHNYLRRLMRTPYDGTKEGIILYNGNRIKGTISRCTSDELTVQLKTLGSRTRTRTLKWEELSIKQYFAFFEFYIEKRLEMVGAPQNEIYSINPKEEAADDYFRAALLADWYGHYEKAREYIRLAKRYDSSLEHEINKIFYYYFIDKGADVN